MWSRKYMHHVSFLGEIYQKTRHGKSAKRQRPIASSISLLRALCCAFFRSAVKKITNSKTKIKKKPTKNQKPAQKQKDRVLARKNAPGASKNRVLARKDRDLSVQKAPKNRKKRTKTKKNTHKKCVRTSVSGEAGRFQGKLVCDFCKH